jgi:hypothetical protein
MAWRSLSFHVASPPRVEMCKCKRTYSTISPVIQCLPSCQRVFVWLVADSWCWFVLREKYCWLVAGDWFVLREKSAAGWWLISQANRALFSGFLAI